VGSSIYQTIHDTRSHSASSLQYSVHALRDGGHHIAGELHGKGQDDEDEDEGERDGTEQRGKEQDGEELQNTEGQLYQSQWDRRPMKAVKGWQPYRPK
jgi:hypothetical protein